MNRALPFAVFLMIGVAARGEDLSGRALLSYESRESERVSTDGFRQQYDLRLSKAFTTTSLVRLFCRIDDFRGTNDYTTFSQNSRSRQIQPVAELILNTDTLQMMARSEWLNLQSKFGDNSSTRTIQRSLGQMTWQPDNLPVLHILGARNATRDDNARIDLTDDNALASLQYHWRGLQATAEERYFHSTDPAAGYDRKTTAHTAGLTWASTHLGGRLSVTAAGDMQLMTLAESAVGGTTSSIPTPLAISRALWSVDDTPLDGRDHPPVSYPGLIDSNLNTSTGLSLGPDGLSFQNLVIDLARVDRADEIRIVVRDPAGNPLQHGGGAVTWDLYTSDDGQLWRAVTSAQTTFNAPLSLYAVTFDLTTGRWFKVVNFGVNADQTFIAEIQAYYHTTVTPGKSRNGTQNTWTGTTTFTYQPIKTLLIGYAGTYSALHERFGTLPRNNTSDIEHLGSIQYDLPRHFTLRGQMLRRTAQTYTGRGDDLTNLSTFVDYTPTRQLKVTLEAGQQDEAVQDSKFRLDTRALHVTAFVIRSVTLTSDVGMQTQTIANGAGTADRRFFNITGNLQLAPSLRMLLNGTLQRTSTDSTDPAVQLLGAQRDDRVSSELIWRSGRQLTLGARYGWAAGQLVSGFTQRYHVDWYPFGDGTLSLGGAFDQDIDPTVNRRARRLIFNPRWLMNRWVMLDLNYTSVSTSFATTSLRQRTLYATVTLT